jgi:hypothetical protein
MLLLRCNGCTTLHPLRPPHTGFTRALSSTSLSLALCGLPATQQNEISYTIKDITSLSWRPASADNGYWAKLPENHANIALSGQKGWPVNPWAHLYQPFWIWVLGNNGTENPVKA